VATYLCFSLEDISCQSVSYELRKKPLRGAQLVPIGMPAVCWKTRPSNITNMLSTKTSSSLMTSVSENFCLQNKICTFFKQGICMYVYEPNIEILRLYIAMARWGFHTGEINKVWDNCSQSHFMMKFELSDFLLFYPVKLCLTISLCTGPLQVAFSVS
jgi:hypothetical protein